MYLQVSTQLESATINSPAPRCLPDIQTTPQVLGPLLARSRSFVLIQNGIGIELDLQHAVPSAVVMSGCAWIDATVVDQGRTLRHGPLVGRALFRPKLFAYISPLGATGSRRSFPVGCTPQGTAFFRGARSIDSVCRLAQRWRRNARTGHGHCCCALEKDYMVWPGWLPPSCALTPSRNAGFSTFATLGDATLPDICHEPARSFTMPVVRGFMEEVGRQDTTHVLQ